MPPEEPGRRVPHIGQQEQQVLHALPQREVSLGQIAEEKTSIFGVGLVHVGVLLPLEARRENEWVRLHQESAVERKETTEQEGSGDGEVRHGVGAGVEGRGEAEEEETEPIRNELPLHKEAKQREEDGLGIDGLYKIIGGGEITVIEVVAGGEQGAKEEEVLGIEGAEAVAEPGAATGHKGNTVRSDGVMNCIKLTELIF